MTRERRKRAAEMNVAELTELCDMWRAGRLPPDAPGADRFNGYTSAGARDAAASLSELLVEARVEALNTPATELDIDTVELIHWHQDSYANFCSKVSGNMCGLAGVKVSEIRPYLQQLLPLLWRDLYFTINSYFRVGSVSRKTGQPYPLRREKHLAYLNACYVDLDCYKRGMDWIEADGITMRAAEENLIPVPSLTIRSGRGLYLVWLLQHERDGYRQKARPHEIACYKQVNRSLIATLRRYEPRLFPDVNAIDAARVLRVPGSIHGKSGQQVVARVNVVGGGVMPTFTLPGLANMFNIPVVNPRLPPAKDTTLRPITNRGSCPARSRGWRAKFMYRIEDMLAIAQHRGGIRQGQRWRTISFLACWAKQAGWPLHAIVDMTEDFAKQCTPPYPSEGNDVPVQEIVMCAWRDPIAHRFRNCYLADSYSVTADLAGELNLRSIVPPEVREARAAAPSPRTQARADRRKAIEDMLQGKGSVPTLRVIKARLAAVGIEASLQTINRDLRAILPE